MTDNLPSVVRSAVEPQSHYSGYREVLRFDFWYSCAYCSVAETEAWGFGFQIDHFEPQSNNSTDAHTYSNLMWSCEPCNSKKSNWWPDESMRARGIRYLRPDMDVFAEHLELAGYRLKALSKAGEYTIEMLYLNRAALPTSPRFQ